MTVSAPAAIALATSPEDVMPPSAMTGTPCRIATSAHVEDRGDLRHADAGDDAGRADRAGPDADLDASAPASISASAASAVATLPAISSMSNSALIRRTISSTPREWPCAVSTTSTSTSAATSAAARSSASVPTPTAAPTRRRPRSSLVASG